MLELPLNEPFLLFLPSSLTGFDDDRVVRVTVETKRREADLDTLAGFFLNQSYISRLVVKLIISSVSNPLPPSVFIQGDGYTLSATRRSWNYGKGLDLLYGENKVVHCPDKWFFVFRTL